MFNNQGSAINPCYLNDNWPHVNRAYANKRHLSDSKWTGYILVKRLRLHVELSLLYICDPNSVRFECTIVQLREI